MSTTSSYANGTTAAPVVVASTTEDANAVEAVKSHHAQLAGALGVRVDRLVRLAGGGSDDATTTAARDDLVAFCATELLPHAAAEEGALYPVAAEDVRARLLVEAMIAEHRVLEGLVRDLRTTADPVLAAAIGTGLRVLFETHLAKENDLILPLVAGDPSRSLSAALAGMHELLGPDAHDEQDHGPDAAGGCGCGGHDEADPVLDVRAVPHAIRHATVFGALGAVPRGGSLVLVAPHDPIPLLGQIEDREPGAFGVSYDERGPEAWRVRLTRVV